MDKVRLAQIGILYPHASSWRETLLLMPEVEIVAFYDPDPEAARAGLPGTLQARPMYADLAALLAIERPEAVLICLPNDLCSAAIVQCARAGVHVYAEKPCARTAAEFLPAAEAIRTAGVQFATGFIRHVNAAALAIRGIVADGLLGRLTSAEGRLITSSVTKRDPRHFLFSQERSGGGVLHWLGCHLLDLMRWCTSEEVSEVAAVLGTLSGEPIGVEDTATLALRYTNGMVGSLHCAYVADKATDQITFALRGTLGWLYWEGLGPEVVVRSIHPAWVSSPTRVLRFEQDQVGGYGGTVGIAALRAFIAAFREGATPAFGTDDILRVLEVLDAAHESDRTGQRVRLAQPRLDM